MTAREAAATEVAVTATLGELVASRPARAELLERLKLDYCCGVARTLAEACRERGLDAVTVCRLIVTMDAAADLPVGVESHDWRQASLSELCNHIVDVHHAALRRELPQIQELLDSVMGRSASINGPAVDVIEHDHDKVADKLAQLRALTADYDTAQALCRTHHRLLEALRSLELELHHHVHEENNILLPRLRSLLRTPHEHAALEAPRPHSRPASRPDRSREELPRCCQGWLAEQTHRTISSRAR